MNNLKLLPMAALLALLGFAPLAVAGDSQCKFGSPAFVQEWNGRFSAKQANDLAVLPKHGFAVHAPAQAAKPVSGDYFNEQIAAGAMRWARMPIRVCITGGGTAGGDYATIFCQAMDEWSRQSSGKIMWLRVQYPEDADLTVSWAPNAPYAGENGNTRAAYSNIGGERVITHVQIDISASLNNRPMSSNEMRKTCLHEIGHALGLVHTGNPADIMYFQSNPAQVAELTARDATTIQRLYTIQ